MNFLKNIFKNKQKKTVLNLLTALMIGILLIVCSNMFFKKQNSVIKKGEETVSSDKTNYSTTYVDYASIIEKKLEINLADVEGVGKVKAMVTLKNGREIVIAEESNITRAKNNENSGNSILKESLETKEEKKGILNSNDEPVILKEIQPKIEGVVIIAQGGGNVEIKNSIIRAVQALLGIEAHKIEVLKMK